AKLSLSTLDFGWTEVGSEPITKVLNVSNVGGGTLTLSNIDNLAPPFTLQETLSTISLGIGQSVDLHFVFTPTTSQEYSQSVIFKSNGSDKTLTLQAYAYKQGSLLETFEESSSIPNLFRVRTNNWKIAKQGAYQGDNFLQSTSTDMDTLIGPKVNKGNLIFFLKDGNYSSKDLQILYSTDLQNYTVLKTLADLQYNTQSYTKNTIDLSTLPSNAFIAIAGYRFNIDNILLTDPIRPSHDLYLASSNIPSSYNERTDVPISVEVKNWGSTKENSIQLQLLNQNGEVLKDTTFSENINAKDSLNLKFYWGPVPSTKELYIKAILALDEDLTNNISNKQKINVTPYIGVLKISPNTLNFDLLMANKESDTLSFTIQNTGIAPVEISRVKIKAPFSVLESNFTIEPKSSKTLKVLFSQAVPKSYKDSLVLVQNGLGDSIVILSGNIQRKGDLFESFENGEFPPFLWRQTSSLKNKWHAYNSSSHAYRGDYSAYQNNTQEFDTLITPKLHIESGDKLSFYAKHWSNDACVLSVIYSADLKNWQLLHTYEGADGNGELQRTIQNYSIENLPQGNFFIAFVGKAEPMIDYIQGPAVIYPQKDLKVVSTIMPKECNRNMEIQVQAEIQNIGKQTAKNYTVQLKQNQTILAQIEGDSLEFLKTKTIEIPFVPLEVGNLQGIYVEVNLIGDEDSVNNKGTIGNILVRDEFYGEVQVGTTTKTSSSGAWSTNWKYTLNETLYYPEELGIKKGTVIKSIAFAHMPNTQEHRYPIKIWLGETDSMSLKSFWIDASALKQVVQDTVQIKSEGDPTYLSLDLGQGYTYQGKNLVVLLEKGHSAYTSFSFYTTESTHLDRKRSYYQDGSYIYYDTAKPIPYTEKQTSSEYPSIRLSIDRPSVYVTGTIQNEAKQNVEKAVVSLTNGKVVYIDTTDASGKFLIKTSLTGRAYVLDVKAPEYKFTPRTISIGDTNQDLGIITLPANLYTYSVFVWGRPVGAPLKDAVIKLKSQTTTEEFSQSLTSVCDTAIVTFPGLAKGLYTISLKHRDYAHYTQTDIPIYKEESDTIFLQGKEPIKVRGRVLSSIDHSPLQGVAVDFT
ncbi:MAG: choice-of-anchor D domain-containing protein, partial [Bacteroidales bacterium]